MIIDREMLREIIVRELLWPTGTTRREPTDEQRRYAEHRADAVLDRYTRRIRDLAYQDAGEAYREDRSRGR